MDNFKNKTEGFNVEEINLQEELALSLFEVEELEKRYEMGWAPDKGNIKGSYSEKSGWGFEGGLAWDF